MLRIHNSHELRTRLERKSSGKFPTVSRNGTSSPFETFYPKRYTISNNVWPTDGSSHYALYDTLTSVQETKNRRGRYSDTRIHGAQETVLYPCTARQRSEADRVTRESSGRVSKHGYQGGKKKGKEKKKEEKSVRRLTVELAKLSNDPRYDDHLDSLVVGNNGGRSNEGPTKRSSIRIRIRWI